MFRILHRRLPCSGVAVLMFLGAVQAQVRGPEVRKIPSLATSTWENVIVARVGPWQITGTEFKLGYEFGPAFVKRDAGSKERYLNYLIYEKLLALDGQRRGLERWPDVVRQVEEIRGDLATEELYRRDVLGKVRISNRQLAMGVKASRIHLSVRWIYCRAAVEVDRMVQAMRSGDPFDTLYNRQLTAGVTAAERSMETTRFRVQMDNPLFAGIVDSLKRGEVSLPIHGPDGWYIVQLVDGWTNPIATQSDEEKMENDVHAALTQHMADSLSDVYVHKLILSSNPTIVREPFNAIEAFLGSSFLPKDSLEMWGLKNREGARSLSDVTNLLPIAQEILVRLPKNSFRVVDFLDWYRMRSPYIRMDLSSQKGFFQSTEDLVWRMVRDRLLTREAYRRGLQRVLAVERQTQWWKEKMLYTANRNRIADTITDSLPALQKYYEEHLKEFVDDKGAVRPFESVRDDVRRQYHADELTKKLLHELLRLKTEYKITRMSNAVERIPVDDQNDPKAIDVYTVKKGGTYPRTAFPSIDYTWQTWE